MSLKFMNPREQRPDIKAIIDRLGESGKCILSGSTENLTYMPVDTDPGNLLPCNLACVNLDLAKEIKYTSYYTAKLGKYKIMFDTAPQFEAHNLKKIVELSESIQEEMEEVDGVAMAGSSTEELVMVYDLLTENHLKGISSIGLADDSRVMDKLQYMGYVMRELKKMSEKVPNLVI